MTIAIVPATKPAVRMKMWLSRSWLDSICDGISTETMPMIGGRFAGRSASDAGKSGSIAAACAASATWQVSHCCESGRGRA